MGEVKAAEVALEAAKSHQLCKAYAYDKAAKEATAADEAVKASRKALAESTRSMKKAALDNETAQGLYDLFCEGPMKDFESLRDRLAPPPVPEPTAEPEETQMPVDQVAAEDAD